MKNDIQLELDELRNKWAAITNVPEDLAPHGFPGLTKQSITNALGGLSELAQELINAEEYEPSPISRANFSQQLVQLKTLIDSHIPSNPIPHIPGLLSLIETIQNALLKWCNEGIGKAKRGSNAPTPNARIAEGIALVKNVEDLFQQIKDYQQASGQLAQKIAEQEEGVATSKKAIDDLLSTSKITSESIDSANEKAIEGSEKITELTSEFGALKTELETSKQEQQKLFAEFEQYKKRVTEILDGANQAGMAGSFIDRKKKLSYAITFWAIVFICSVVYLAASGSDALASTKTDKDLLLTLLYRLPMVAPLVWLAWFAAKQYGYASRLSEDYAYKAASAMAFEGYKRESTDDGMKLKLLETAITNFGDNPIRIYDGKKHHVSPAQELIDKLLRDNKAVDLLKAAIEKYVKS